MSIGEELVDYLALTGKENISDLVESKGADITLHNLYLNFYPDVYRLALRNVSNPDDAEEVMQKVFILVWQKINSRKVERPALPWLLSVTINVARNHYKSMIRAKKRLERAANELSPSNYVTESLGQDHQLDLNRVLDLLPSRYRQIIVLVELEGYNLSDAAQVLGIKYGTARMQLSRAKEKLKMILQNPKYSYNT